MNTRNTIQRTLVRDTVKELMGHVTADEVYAALKQKHPDISRGTVYRNLNLLSDIGELLKVEIPNGADRYEYRRHKHYHATCVKCGRVFDADMDYMKDLEKSVKDSHGFIFTGHDIIFKGICLECNSN